MDRTLLLQLNPTPEQAALLKRTLQEYTACFNEVAHVGFTTPCRNGTQLHKETYYPLRVLYPDLPSQLVCAARVKATEAVRIGPDVEDQTRERVPQVGCQGHQARTPCTTVQTGEMSS